MQEPLTPEQQKAAWFSFFEQTRARTVMGALDIRLVDVEEDRIIIEMPITDAVRQPMGLLHGGVSMVLAETAASMHSCWGIDLTKMHPVGVEINGSHLRSASEGTVRAVGVVIRRSRTLIVHQIDLYHVETDKHLCTSRVTNLLKSH